MIEATRLNRTIQSELAEILNKEKRTREDAQKAAISIHLDCMKILGERKFLLLNSEDMYQQALLYVHDKRSIEDNPEFKNRNVDLVIVKIDKLDTENLSTPFQLVETYAFRRIYYDDGCAIRKTLLFIPQRVITQEEVVGKDELDRLAKEIRETSAYKNMVKTVPLRPSNR